MGPAGKLFVIRETGTSKGFVERKCAFHAPFVRENDWKVLKLSLATCEASPCRLTRAHFYLACSCVRPPRCTLERPGPSDVVDSGLGGAWSECITLKMLLPRRHSPVSAPKRSTHVRVPETSVESEKPAFSIEGGRTHETLRSTHFSPIRTPERRQRPMWIY